MSKPDTTQLKPGWLAEESERNAPEYARIRAERDRCAAIEEIEIEFHRHAGSMAVAIYDLRRGREALSDLYRKTEGNMRTCNRNASILCNERQCHSHGCARANDILKGCADAE